MRRSRYSLRPFLTAILSWVVLPVQPALAQSPGDSEVPEARGKVVVAHRVRGTPPRIDGVLNDSVWSLTDSVSGLVQWEPNNMDPMSERTVVRIAYDDQYIYVAAMCYDGEAGEIASGIGRRDDLPPSDEFMVGFDPRHDHLTGYVFQTNPSGVFRDFTFFDDTRSDSDYDAVWEVETAIDERGWTAEFRIPFSQMRFGSDGTGPAVWGFDVRREILRKGESGQWVGRPRGDVGQVSRWGHLVFEHGLPAPRRIELIPYSAARLAEPSGPGGADGDLLGGADVRLGLGTGATLTGTILPDFGQVEQDPAVLNLTIFESFFPEKRPFFLEDSRTFIPPYGLFRLFHSRRIGRSPRRYTVLDTDSVVDRPEQTTILGAAKVTGRTATWNYGVLNAVTSREHAVVDSLVDLTDPSLPSGSRIRVSRMIEPLTNYAAARVQRNILGGSSNVGLVGTGVVRENDYNAFAGGLDYNIRLFKNRLNWNGHWAVSRAPVSGEMRTGFGGMTNLDYSGKHVFFGSHFDHFDEDFQITDLGFIRTRLDRNLIDLWAGYNQPDPRGSFREYGFNVWGTWGWNGDGLVFDKSLGGGFWSNLHSFWNFWGNVGHNFERLDDLDTRGGPPIVTPANIFANFGFGSDSRKSWRVFGHAFAWKSRAGGWQLSFSPEIRLKPSERAQMQFRISYSFGKSQDQWITNTDTDQDGETDYVYGSLHRDVVNITARGTYAFTRDLSLEFFLQPFVAVGDYVDIRKLAQPRTREFVPVTLDYDPDFNSKSLRGNLVLRWEYLRGSALFVVWGFSNFDDARAGRFSLFRDLGSAFSASGTHVLTVKMSYWMNL